jgi:hypothetical protein
MAGSINHLRLSVIDAFSVDPASDDDFIADWDRARELLVAGGACREMVLHRALRRDVELRFVSFARVPSRGAWEQAVSDPAQAAFAASLYELTCEHGTHRIEGGVLLVAPVSPPDDEHDRMLEDWRRARAVLDEQRGYLGSRLYSSLGPADFRFVELARWSSPLMFARALQRPELQRATNYSQAALYQVVRD